MPGLGDALSKAMNDSQRGVDDLVRRAAENEGESPQTDITKPGAAMRPRTAAAGRSQPVSQGEKEFLVVPLAGAQEVASPPPARAGDQAVPRTMVLPRPSGLPKTQQPPRPDRSASPPSPAGAAVPPSSAVEPIAPFAPSGVIRRQLRRPAKAGGGSKSSSGDELLVSGADRRPIYEELPNCRLLPVFPGADAYRHPSLAKGVGGVVQAILAGRAGTPAMLTFCGAARSAGSTTVAAAVALALAAQVRLRVLLVDADFRSPGLEGLVGSGEGLGLAEVLVGGASLENAVVCSQNESLAVLPLGRPATPAGELLGVARLLEGPALGRMLDACRGLFDAVLFDAGDTNWSGAALLAGAVGSAVLVVRSSQTGARDARRARRALGHYGARVIGAVLNGAPADAER
jgi:Mrp family chromosome partitioning ATPase